MGRCDPKAGNPHIISPQKHEKRQNDRPAGNDFSDDAEVQGLRTGSVESIQEFLCIHGHYLFVLLTRAQVHELIS